MELYIVEDGKLVEYERSGRCNGCGECCGVKNTITYQVQVAFDSKGEERVGEPWEDWSAWEGYTILWAQGLWWYFKVTKVEDIPSPCRKQDQETGRCSIWKTDEWPAICRYWPFKPSDLEPFPECGFSFKRDSQQTKEV